MHPFTREHLGAARAMPRKTPASRRARKALAAFFREHRRQLGRGTASRLHRARIVTSGSEANRRLREIS